MRSWSLVFVFIYLGNFVLCQIMSSSRRNFFLWEEISSYDRKFLRVTGNFFLWQKISRVCHSLLFVENVFNNCFIWCSMTIEYLKYNFLVKNIFPNAPSRGVKVKNVKIFKCSTVHLVGTLNLCLKMPDSMKKVWAQSDQCDPRKSPKTVENLLFSQLPIFWHILDILSAQDDPIWLRSNLLY